MGDQINMELNWSITDNGIDVTLDQGETMVAGLSVDTLSVAEEVAEDVDKYMEGDASSDSLAEWLEFRNTLNQMTTIIDAKLKEVYHDDPA